MFQDNKFSINLSKAFQITEGHYFNSENLFYENLHIETGYSVNTLKKELRPLFIFKDYQMVYTKPREYGFEYMNLPNYILNTRRIETGEYWLKEREYKILIYLDNLKWYVSTVNKELKANSPIYVSCNGIARAVGCTYSEALNSMHKLELYFKDFWVFEDNFQNRIHPESCSLTINLPPRKQWKRIIEAKVIEMTGLADLAIDKPYYINEEDMSRLKRFWKKGKKISLAIYAKIKKHNKIQEPKLKEGHEKKEQESETWLNYLNEAIYFLTSLVDLNIISEVVQSREIKALNAYDPDNREQRLEIGLANLKLKYSIPVNNSPIP